MNNHPSRRAFIKSALAVPAALALTPSFSRPASAGDTAETTALPTRQLGKGGRRVTMLSLGGMMSAYSPEYLDIAWSMGIRYFDNADCYIGKQSEHRLGSWLAKYPQRRSECFIVSKDHPHQGPEQMLEMIDRRLEAIGTKYLDAFYIHGIGPREYGPQSLEWPKSDAFRKVAAQLKDSGKVKMVGFSCHDGQLTDYLNAAAQGGFVDIIMLKYTPFFQKGDGFDLALDACHKAGIGLVAMKTMRTASDVPKRLPEFDKIGLTVHQAVLHSVWSDPRISAVCNNIDNVEQMENSSKAAREYKRPLKQAHMNLLKETILAGRRTMCPGCPACEAQSAVSALAFHDISRYVTYYEQDGSLDAKASYLALPAERRDASDGELAALRNACAFRTDYPEILRRASRYFA